MVKRGNARENFLGDKIIAQLNAWCELLRCRHWKQKSYPLHETWFGLCVGKSAFAFQGLG